MSQTDTILNRNANADAKELCYPVIERLTENGVYVIISPSGAMNNIVGEDKANEFIEKYKEKYLESNLVEQAERREKRRVQEVAKLENQNVL